MEISRRSFIATGTVAAAGVALASPADALQKLSKAKARHVIYRLSVRGRRTSNLAKVWCANLRFKTKDAARRHPRPHPKIHARIIPLDVSANEYHRLFIASHTHVADLRELRGFRVVGL
jgi:hypothetical protein